MAKDTEKHPNLSKKLLSRKQLAKKIRNAKENIKFALCMNLISENISSKMDLEFHEKITDANSDKISLNSSNQNEKNVVFDQENLQAKAECDQINLNSVAYSNQNNKIQISNISNNSLILSTSNSNQIVDQNISDCDSCVENKIYDESTSDCDLHIESKPCDPFKIQEKKINSRGFILFDHFLKQIKNLDNHSKFGCTFGNMVLYNYRRYGLYYKLFFKCELCNFEARVTTDNDEYCMGINKSMVLGCNDSGISYAQMEKVLAAADVPFMSPNTFIKMDFDVFENMLKGKLK